MKYKITGIVSLLSAILLVFAVYTVFYVKEETRYIEHLEKTVSECKSCNKKSLCTHLPIIKIETNGVEIPGKPYHDKETKTVKHTLAADGSTTILAKILVTDKENQNNHLSDTPSLTSDIRIRIRGNSSRHFAKAPYLIDLVNSDGTNNYQELLGMDAHHEWALHGPYLDKTLIRNYMWYNLSGLIMDYAPNVRFCELVINGEYRGLYLLTETITGGKDGTRIPVSFDRKDNTFTGFILRHDRGSDNEFKNVDPLSIYTRRTDKKINIVYPGVTNLTSSLKRGIELEFSAFEKAIYSYDFDDEEKGYKGTVDIDSFVDYLLINEISLNRDAGLFSTYIYMDTDRKYKMCVWDFNNCLDNYEEVENPAEGFALHGTIWFNRIIQDDDFTERIIERYRELRKTVFSDEYLFSFIDDTISYLGDAVQRNYEKWGYSFGEEYDRLYPKYRNPRSYDEAVSDMKTSLKERLIWLDENIECIKQYSASSKTHESHETHE